MRILASKSRSVLLLLFFPMIGCSWLAIPRFAARTRRSKLLPSQQVQQFLLLPWQKQKQNQNRAVSIDSTMKRSISQIPCPPVENDSDDYSLYHLQQRAQWLIDNHTALGKTCIAIAGGGGHALSTLAATSGASQLLLEGTVTYDRSSFQTYVGKNLPNDKTFSYSSVDAAVMASQSALLQGMQIQSRHADGFPTLTALRDTVGVGSASTLKTTTKGGMSKSGRPSHGNIVATRANGTQVCMNLTLNCPTQNRFQQDVFVSHMILQNLEELAKQSTQPMTKNGISSSSSPLGELSNAKPEEFEGITLQQWTTTSSNLLQEGGEDSQQQQQHDSISCPVQSAAHRILSGREEAVLLLPKAATTAESINSDVKEHDCSFLEPLLYPVLPDNCLIIPGSFNPPHQGHTALAQAAVDKVSTEQPRPVVFEISIKNADKPSMDPEEVAQRVSIFQEVMNQNKEMEQWGILLTSAPLFNDKVRVLRQYAPSGLTQDPKFPGPLDTNNRWCFVIGTDTMERILNPKYYDNSFEKMLESQRSMNVDFVVGGRLDQKSKDKFVTGEEILKDMPSDIQEMFVLLGEDDFRVDISSTELREEQQQLQSQNT